MKFREETTILMRFTRNPFMHLCSNFSSYRQQDIRLKSNNNWIKLKRSFKANKRKTTLKSFLSLCELYIVLSKHAIVYLINADVGNGLDRFLQSFWEHDHWALAAIIIWEKSKQQKKNESLLPNEPKWVHKLVTVLYIL